MSHEIALSSERCKDDYDRDLPEMAHSPVGEDAPRRGRWVGAESDFWNG